MPKYNFEDDNNNFDKTRRMDDITQTIKSINSNGVDLDRLKDLVSVPDGGEYDDEFQTTRDMLGRKNDETSDFNIKRRSEPPKREPRYEQIRGGGSYNRGPQNNNSKIILIIVMACILVFAAFFLMSFNSTKKNEETEKENSITDSEMDEIVNSENKHMGVVTDVKNDDTIYYLDVSSDDVLSLKSSDILNIKKDKKEIEPSDVKIGDIILIEEDEDKKLAVEIDSVGFIKENVTDAKFDFDKNTLKIKEDTYKLLDDTLYLDNYEKTSKNSIGEYDTLTIKGNSSDVYSVNVTAKQAYIQVKNANEIENGTISINKGEEKPLKSGKIAIPSGGADILFKGTNIKETGKSLTLEEDKTEEITLEIIEEVEEKPVEDKKAYLFIKSNVDGFTLYLNGTQTPYAGEPISVKPGEMTIKVEKEGYKPFTKTVNIVEDMNTVNVQLESIVMGSITVTSTPKSVGVYIDGKLEGISPVTITKPVGDYVLTAKKADYYDLTIPITIEEGEVEIPISLTEIN